MAVLFVFGKPGAGKSLWAMNYLARELRTTRRPIITNLPVNLGELNAYLQHETPDAISRVRVIDSQTEIKQWWRFRGRTNTDGPEPCRPWADMPEPDRDGRTDFATNPGPVLYILDEIHTAFNARSWASTGPAALWYLSQHRKLGDDVILISQTPAQVDKQLRSLSQEWIHLCNLSKLKLFLLWTLPNRLLWKSYANMPARGEPLLATGFLKVDVQGLARCYDTSQGAGIAGGMDADRGKKQSGLHWSTLTALPLLCVGLWYGGAHLFAEVASGALPFARKHSNQPPAPAQSFAPAAAVAPEPPKERKLESPPPPTASVQPSLQIVAWVRSGPDVRIWLSDGSAHDRRTIQRITKTHATIDGITYPLP